MKVKDWNGREIECARSRGGVLALAHPYDNLVRTGCSPWPPAEIAQKLYRSRHSRAFTGESRESCESGLGYYCDLQSVHSEDAITWSVFGTAARAREEDRKTWLADLFLLMDLPTMQPDDAEISLWRRVPHPDTLVPGGPEIDVTIVTTNALILVEAKWLSAIGTKQGKQKNKDQIQLRGEFLRGLGSKLFPSCSQFVVMGIGLSDSAFIDSTPDEVAFRTTTWEQVCSIDSHPLGTEMQDYFTWKTEYTVRN